MGEQRFTGTCEATTIYRRRFLALGAVGITAGCLENGDNDPPTDTPTVDTPDLDATPTPEGPAVTPTEDQPDQADAEEEKEPSVEPTFEGFTHFPVDFASLFEGWEELNLTNEPPITPFYFYAHHHTEGPRKWYLGDLQTPPHEPVYLPADGATSIWRMRKLGETEVVAGETIHVDADIDFEMAGSVAVFYQHLGLRDDIVRTVEESDEDDVEFSAGTHIGYMYYPPWHTFDFGVEDWNDPPRGVSATPDHRLNVRRNPLDYFVPSLREELLALYEPLYERMREEGVVAWSDLTDSRTDIHVAGTLAGLWCRDDLASDELFPPVNHWGLINFVGIDNLHTDTFWRVLEHPWNQEQGFAGLFTEAVSYQGDPPVPLYDGEPIAQFGSRLYLLEGDLSAGVAMIVEPRWDPLDAENEHNHPSVGERRYLRFVVEAGADRWGDRLHITGAHERNALEEGVDDALTYRRDPDDE